MCLQRQPDVYGVRTAARRRHRVDHHLVDAEFLGKGPHLLGRRMEVRSQPSGIAPIQPALWLVEGLVFYLEPATVHRLLDDITRARLPTPCPGGLDQARRSAAAKSQPAVGARRGDRVELPTAVPRPKPSMRLIPRQ